MPIDFRSPAQRKAIEELVVAQIRKHRLDRCESPAVLFTADGRIEGRFGYGIMAAAAAGQWDAARALQRMIDAGDAYVRSFDRAASALVFGDRAAAAALFVDNLEHDGGLANLTFSICYPPYDAIRTEPVWKACLARHQLK